MEILRWLPGMIEPGTSKVGSTPWVPDALVNSSKSWVSVVSGWRKAKVPFQVWRNEFRQRMSDPHDLLSESQAMVEISAFLLRVMNIHKNDNIVGCLWQQMLAYQWVKVVSFVISCSVNSFSICMTTSLVFGNPTCWSTESNSWPKKMKMVARPST